MLCNDFVLYGELWEKSPFISSGITQVTVWTAVTCTLAGHLKGSGDFVGRYSLMQYIVGARVYFIKHNHSSASYIAHLCVCTPTGYSQQWKKESNESGGWITAARKSIQLKNQCERLPASLGTKRRELTYIAKPDWFRLFLYLRSKLSKGSGNARRLQPDDCKDTCLNNQAIALMCAYVTYLDVSGYAGLNGSIRLSEEITRKDGATRWRDRQPNITKQTQVKIQHQWVWFCRYCSVKTAAFSSCCHHNKTCLNSAARGPTPLTVWQK